MQNSVTSMSPLHRHLSCSRIGSTFSLVRHLDLTLTKTYDFVVVALRSRSLDDYPSLSLRKVPSYQSESTKGKPSSRSCRCCARETMSWVVDVSAACLTPAPLLNIGMSFIIGINPMPAGVAVLSGSPHTPARPNLTNPINTGHPGLSQLVE